MSFDNRSLDGLDWQERSDGSWVAQTAHYKLIAYKKDDETMSKYSADSSMTKYTHASLLYQWHETEDIWTLIDKSLFGAESMEEAKIDCEQQLGRQLQKMEHKQRESGAAFSPADWEAMLRTLLGGRDHGTDNPFRR